MQRQLTLFVLLIAAFVSCSKEEEQKDEKPVLTITSVNVLPNDGAAVNLEITSLGSWNDFDDYGLVWNTYSDPDYHAYRVSLGNDPTTGTKIINITNSLHNNVTYYVRAFVMSGVNIIYSNNFTMIGEGCPPPEITSFTPDSVNGGTEVTIYGHNFNSNPAKNYAQFGTSVVEVESATPDQLVIRVPSPELTSAELLSVTTGLLTGTSVEKLVIVAPWTRLASFPFSFIAEPVSFVINNTAYVCVWAQGDPSGLVLYAYNAVLNTWERKADFPAGKRWNHTSFVIGNKAYVGLGWDYSVYPNIYYNDFYAYDPQVNQWSRIADFPGAGRLDCSGSSSGGKGLLADGTIEQFGERLNEVWMYSPESNSWSQKNNNGNRIDYTVSYNDVDYLISYTGAICRYDDEKDEFTVITNYASQNWFTNGFVLNNKMYFFELTPVHDNFLWTYDLATNVWGKGTLTYPFDHIGEAETFTIGNFGYCLSPVDDGKFFAFRLLTEK